MTQALFCNSLCAGTITLVQLLLCASGRVQQPQRLPGLELERRRNRALELCPTLSGAVCMHSPRSLVKFMKLAGGIKTKVYVCILETYLQVAPTGPAFSQCTACSPPVLEALDREGWELVKKVGEKPNHLEDLTGLTALMQVWKITFDNLKCLLADCYGLPIRGYRQNAYKICMGSANNLLLADHNFLSISYRQTRTFCQ